jgi:hypothetical protein
MRPEAYGWLQRAALTQSALAKERRELKEQQQRAVMESAPKDLGRTWADPLAGSNFTCVTGTDGPTKVQILTL